MEEPFGTCDPHLGRSAVKEFVSVWELPFYLANLRSQTGGNSPAEGHSSSGAELRSSPMAYYNIRQILKGSTAVF